MSDNFIAWTKSQFNQIPPYCIQLMTEKKSDIVHMQCFATFLFDKQLLGGSFSPKKRIW